jgi:hypothetical protein
MFINYKESPEYANNAYINHIKKLYPNITEKELDEMFEGFKKDMEKQSERSDASLRK